MGRVYEHLTRGEPVDQDLMDADCLWNTWDQEEEGLQLTDEGLEEYAYNYENEAKKDHNR